jgi:hypothetical protein
VECFVSGELRFSWQAPNGDTVNWWSGGQMLRDGKRFVHNEWGNFAVAVDLHVREAQIAFAGERVIVKFAELPDEATRLAFEAVCETRNAAFAAELLMRAIGRDDLADMIGAKR